MKLKDNYKQTTPSSLKNILGLVGGTITGITFCLLDNKYELVSKTIEYITK